MQIATAAAGDYLCEQCLTKQAQSTTSIISHTCVTALAISKWDLLKLVPVDTVPLFQHHAVVGSIEEDRLKEGFYRHLRWERFRSALVAGVLAERDIRKGARPANVWESFRERHPAGVALPWK